MNLVEPLSTQFMVGQDGPKLLQENQFTHYLESQLTLLQIKEMLILQEIEPYLVLSLLLNYYLQHIHSKNKEEIIGMYNMV